MDYPYFSEKTLDDLLHSAIKEILAHGGRTKNQNGHAIELTGVLLELKNPRARLSLTEMRGKLFSCLGELCWYLAKSRDLKFIRYYIQRYEDFAEGSIIYGGYGPRLFNWKGLNQVFNIIKLLKKRPDSRQAVIQLFDARDIAKKHGDTPCTCTMQFMVRKKKLHMVTHMRSNDAYIGLPHDVFSFTMIQEIVARSLSIDIGSYKHMVGSLHVYKRNVKDAKLFLNEGLQSTKNPMLPMPKGNPWKAIQIFLRAESAIRRTGQFDNEVLKHLHPYWADLIRLLQIYRNKKDENLSGVKKLQKEIVSDAYRPFINECIRHLQPS